MSRDATPSFVVGVRRWRATGTLLAACLAVGAALAAACSHSQTREEKLTEQALNASDTDLPDWMFDGADSACPTGHTCVIGRSSGAVSRSRAISASEADAYRQLAERAFPVEVRGQLSFRREQSSRRGETTRSSTTKVQTQTRVAGRIREAEVVDHAWIERREYTETGSREIYEAWSLIAMETAQLETLYEEEKRRSERRISELTARVRDSIDALETRAKPADVRAGIVSHREVTAEMEGLLEVSGYDELASQLDRLETALAERVRLVFTGAEYDFGTRRVRVDVELLADGEPVSGVELAAEATCASSPPSVGTTSPEGTTSSQVELETLFADCNLRVWPAGAEGLSAERKLGPIATCFDIDSRVSLSGPIGDDLQSELASAATSAVVSAMPDAATRCEPEDAGERPLEVRADVELRADEPAPVSGYDLWSSGARVKTQVEWRAADRGWETLADGDTTLNVRAENRAALPEGLVDGAAEFVRKTVRPVGGRL
ncbi:MAG: hypothetical protein ABEL76_02585 [Bradymonadaceae bacterium]